MTSVILCWGSSQISTKLMEDPSLISVDWDRGPHLQSGVCQFIESSVKVGYGEKTCFSSLDIICDV